jgi:uncharacterized membrane protein YkvA (DUF1232 family)
MQGRRSVVDESGELVVAEQARVLALGPPHVERLVLRDPRVPRPQKALLVALAGYLALPFDLVPDFIPIAWFIVAD